MLAGWRNRAATMGGAMLALVALALAAPARAVPVASRAVEAASAPAVGLAGVRLGGDSAATRVVLDLDGRAAARLASFDPAAGRAVLVLPTLLTGGPTEGRGLGLLRSWSLRDGAEGSRLTLELAPGAAVARRFLIPPAAEGGGWRYVIDLIPAGEAVAVSPSAPEGSASVAERGSLRPPNVTGVYRQAQLDSPGSRTTGGPPATRTAARAAPSAWAPTASSRPPSQQVAAAPERPLQRRMASIAEPSSSAPLRTPVAATRSADIDAALDAAGLPHDEGDELRTDGVAGSAALPAASGSGAVRPAAAMARGGLSSPAVRVASAPVPVRTVAGHGLKVVVIDAGHGGHDTGAQSLVRNEKDITLAAALALRARLLKTGRYKVVMTRDSDVFIPLSERVQIARRAGADLFISLHADSAGSNPTPHGASVYTLSDHGQTRVNYVLGPHEWFSKPGGRADPGVKQILLDLTQNTTRNRSSQFAGLLIRHIGDKVDLLPRTHRDAGYFVLLAPDVPAALLEMGFITNPGDEMRLTDPEQRGRLMDGVAEAIDEYFFGAARLAAG